MAETTIPIGADARAKLAAEHASGDGQPAPAPEADPTPTHPPAGRQGVNGMTAEEPAVSRAPGTGAPPM